MRKRGRHCFPGLVAVVLHHVKAAESGNSASNSDDPFVTERWRHSVDISSFSRQFCRLNPVVLLQREAIFADTSQGKSAANHWSLLPVWWRHQAAEHVVDRCWQRRKRFAFEIRIFEVENFDVVCVFLSNFASSNKYFWKAWNRQSQKSIRAQRPALLSLKILLPNRL